MTDTESPMKPFYHPWYGKGVTGKHELTGVYDQCMANGRGILVTPDGGEAFFITPEKAWDLIEDLSEAISEVRNRNVNQVYAKLKQWFCRSCNTIVIPEHVTFDERHDPRFGCGGPVE